LARVELAWELGAHTGHVSTLLPIGLALKARGHDVRFFMQQLQAGADLEGAAEIPREGAPHWVGPKTFENPLSVAEIFANLGYHDAKQLKGLVDAWRERLWLSHAVVASVAPAAHLASLTLGIPSFEISQGFHVPPPAFPTSPLRDWEPAPRARLEDSDRRVLGAINEVLAAYGVASLNTIGELFLGRTMLLTYPELDIYPERGPAEYYGIPHSSEGSLTPDWPAGRGPRVFAYLYDYYEQLPRLLDSLAAIEARTLMLCRGIPADLRLKHSGGSVMLSAEPMSASRLLPQCDFVICHGSHQMTAQALLAGKPVLLLPTQLEQFLTTRRVVRFGAGLGVAMGTQAADFAAAFAELSGKPAYTAKAAEFAARYQGHDRGAALATMVKRCEAALAQAEILAGH
jgi:UDP:flavonoid glycosyltransferase YjiC (YdhE family)